MGTKSDHTPGTSQKSNAYLGNGVNGSGVTGGRYATATVYGPGGACDVSSYNAYTMSSDPCSFGVVADGRHEGMFYEPGKSEPLESNWLLTGEVPQDNGTIGYGVRALNDFNPAYPSRVPGYVAGAFIHSTNNNGFAGTYSSNRLHGISEGCLLIDRSQWAAFKAQLQGVQRFTVKINRD